MSPFIPYPRTDLLGRRARHQPAANARVDLFDACRSYDHLAYIEHKHDVHMQSHFYTDTTHRDARTDIETYAPFSPLELHSTRQQAHHHLN